MDVFEAIKTRRSIRNYQDRPVEKEKLAKVLEAARLAPSAKNRQEWKFIVIQNEETRYKLAVAAKYQMFIAEAPVVIAACALEFEYRLSCGHPGYAIDLSIAIDHMTLAAVELGLGTCWIGAFYQDQVKQILDVPSKATVVELLPLGYPKIQPPQKSRKSVDEIVRYEKWS
jgi:nitroreductase